MGIEWVHERSRTWVMLLKAPNIHISSSTVPHDFPDKKYPNFPIRYEFSLPFTPFIHHQKQTAAGGVGGCQR